MLELRVREILKTRISGLVHIFMPRYVGGIPESETLVEDVLESLSKPTRKYKRGEERIEAIGQGVANGLSIGAIAEQEGLAISTVKRYARQGGIGLSGKRRPREERIEEIKYDYEGRAKSGRRIIRKPEIDELIREGRTLEHMGIIDGTSRENIRQYLVVTGQDKEWKVYRQAAREAERQDRQFKKQEKSQLLEGLVSILDTRVRNLAQEEGFAVQKTVQYMQSFGYAKGAKHQPETLITRLTRPMILFDRYGEAIKNEEKRSLKQLGEGLGLYPSAIRNILKRGGLESMHGTRERHRTPSEKKGALQRAYSLEIPVADIAYFLELPGYAVQRNFRRIGERTKVNSPFPDVVDQNVLTYRLASQIYEAHDLGFNLNDIAQLSDTNEKVVNHVLNNRSIGGNYEKKIVDVLRVMHGDNTISKPYLEMSKG